MKNKIEEINSKTKEIEITSSNSYRESDFNKQPTTRTPYKREGASQGEHPKEPATVSKCHLATPPDTWYLPQDDNKTKSNTNLTLNHNH